MKKMLTNNLTLKLLSVVAAIMLWLVVMNIDDPYTYRDFSPVQVTMLNENVVTDQGRYIRSRMEATSSACGSGERNPFSGI